MSAPEEVTELTSCNPTASGSSNRRLVGWLIGVWLSAGALWFAWPRHADLRSFDPVSIGQLETRMWRSYYEHRRWDLGVDLYRLSRDEYGFSPWASVRIAFYGARAAIAFQPTRDRAAADAVIPILARYFRVIRQGSGERFDPNAAARAELDWWQLRRENRRWPEYAEPMARVTAIVYGLEVSEAMASARLRAEMMSLRDKKREPGPSEKDWRQIESGLVASWSELRGRVGR